MLPPPPPDTLDALYLYSVLEQLNSTLRDAVFPVSYFRCEIESLATQPELPPAYRQAYGRIVALLTSVEQAIRAGVEQGQNLHMELMEPEWPDWNGPEDADLVAAAWQTIDDINRAETQLVGVVESARKALLEHAEPGLIDWTMPFEYDLAILLDAGPGRRFYETCGDGEEPLRVRIKPYRPDDRADDAEPYNWNIFSGQEAHPLQAGFHGYLMHCIMDHSPIPWRLLPWIRKVEVEVKFYDCEVAWERPVDDEVGSLTGTPG